MRVQFAVVLAALSIAAAPAVAQNSAAVAGNVASSAPAEKSDSAKSSRKATKPDGEKVCKRLSQGKVCMTAEQWKAYQEQF